MVIPRGLGCADWVWNDDTQTHDPCCSQYLEEEGRPCGNGPLKPEHIETGDCGRDHSLSYMFNSGMSPRMRHQLHRVLKEMDEHPWHSPRRWGNRVKLGEKIVMEKSVVYTRFLRIRWHENPLFQSSARIWFGHLEIVIDVISKQRWKKRKKT